MESQFFGSFVAGAVTPQSGPTGRCTCHVGPPYQWPSAAGYDQQQREARIAQSLGRNAALCDRQMQLSGIQNAFSRQHFVGSTYVGDDKYLIKYGDKLAKANEFLAKLEKKRTAHLTQD